MAQFGYRGGEVAVALQRSLEDPDDGAIGMMTQVAACLEVFDPGLVRTRHAAQTACATVLAWATMLAVTSVLGLADTLRITLFGAGACFFGALLVTDPRPQDRARTLDWASVVAAVAAVVTVYLNQTAAWAVAAFLVLQMFLSFALRSRSPRAGNLAWIGALTTLLPVPGTSASIGSDGS